MNNSIVRVYGSVQIPLLRTIIIHGTVKLMCTHKKIIPTVVYEENTIDETSEILAIYESDGRFVYYIRPAPLLQCISALALHAWYTAVMVK